MAYCRASRITGFGSGYGFGGNLVPRLSTVSWNSALGVPPVERKTLAEAGSKDMPSSSSWTSRLCSSLSAFHVDHVHVALIRPASAVLTRSLPSAMTRTFHGQIAGELDVASAGVRDAPAVGQRGAAGCVGAIGQDILALQLGFVGDERGSREQCQTGGKIQVSLLHNRHTRYPLSVSEVANIGVDTASQTGY